MITQDFDRTLDIVSQVTEIEKEKILSSCRQMEYVEARALLIKALSEQGYHYRTIAAYMNRAATSVKALLDGFHQRYTANPLFRKLHTEIIRKVEGK